AIGNEVNRTRVIFKFGYDSGLLLMPMRFGPMFKRPSRKLLRIERAKHPPKIFTADEIKTLSDASTPQLKAMILLGVNAAFGNNDCATLEFRHLHLKGGWVNFPRPKTGIDRR